MRNFICIPRCVKALLAVVVGVVLTMGALTAEIKSPDLDLNIQLNVVLNLAVS